MTILEYLTKLFRDDPTLQQYDITEGSNYHDLVYVTLQKVFEESAAKVIINAADAYNLDGEIALSYEEVANIATQYGIPVPYTNYSKGDITLIFDAPEDVNIPAGTMFLSATADFYTLSQEYVSARYLESNTRTSDGKYQSQPITVYSTSGASADANTIGASSAISLYLSRIEHPAIINGTAGATTEQLASIIRGVVRGISNGSAGSIEALIRCAYPSVTAVEIVGAGDELMTRDMMVNSYVYGAPAVNEQSFFNKVAGNNTTNKNVAYIGMSSAATPPDIDSTYGATELSQIQYINIGDVDSQPLTISSDNTFTDTFASTNNFGARAELECGITSGEEYFYSYGTTWIEPGSSLYLEGDDIDDVLHKTQVIVRDVIYRAYDLVSIANPNGNTYMASLTGITAASMLKLKPGQKIDFNWVRISGEAEYSLSEISIDSVDSEAKTITFTSSNAIDVGTCEEEYPGKVMWTEYQIVGQFSISLTEVLVSVPGSISTQIGNGWFVSEHGYPVGYKVSQNEVYVENEQIVMGGNPAEAIDPLKDIIAKGGTGRFVSSVIRAISLRRRQRTEEVLPIAISIEEEVER